MEDKHSLLKIAAELKNQGKNQEALESYSKAFDALIDEAGLYARHKEGDIEDANILQSKKSLLIEDSFSYLKQDITAASILNEMGLLFRQLGEYENAKQKFEEAIDLIPIGSDYDDPLVNLRHLPVPVSGEIIEDLGQL